MRMRENESQMTIAKKRPGLRVILCQSRHMTLFFQSDAVGCSMLQRVAVPVRYSVLQCVTNCHSRLATTVFRSDVVPRCGRSALQRVAVRCSVWQCVAVVTRLQTPSHRMSLNARHCNWPFLLFFFCWVCEYPI